MGIFGKLFKGPEIDQAKSGESKQRMRRLFDSVVPDGGQYQLVVELVQPAGQGGLAQAFEERKRRLPWDPARVALITSPHGAAIHDFWRLAAQRGQAAHIRLYPVAVQGEGAAPSIVRALETANAHALLPDGPQVIVLIRGGGSLEVAEAVYRSRLPVLAGIGHEVDVTLADLTADVRAATPSHAAQLLWPSRQELLQLLDDQEAALSRGMRRRLERQELQLGHLARLLRAHAPQRQLERLESARRRLSLAMLRAVREMLGRRQRQADHLAQMLRSFWNPTRLAVAARETGALEDRLRAALPRLLLQRQQELLWAERRLLAGGRQSVDRAEAQRERLALRLAACDPLGPLERGYALVADSRGALIRSVRQAQGGQELRIRLQDGSLGVTVAQIRPRPDTAAAEGEE